MVNATEHIYAATARSPLVDANVGPYYIRGCLQGAVQQGHDPAELLTAAQIDPSVYTDPDARINGDELQRLVLTVRNILNDEYLGFLNVRGKVEMSYVVGKSAVNCQTFGEAMKKMVKLVSAMRSDMEPSLVVDWNSDQVELAFKVTGYSEEVEPHILSWLKMYWLYKFQCWLIGQRIELTSVFFIGQPDGSADIVDSTEVFGCPVLYGQDEGKMCFPRHYLGAPIIRNEVELRERDFTYGHTNWFAVPGKDQSISSRVEQLLIDIYREGQQTPNLDVLGDILCCSPRTLSRKLQKEGASFQELKDKVRRSIAEKLLSTTDLSIADIAEKVGYSEPSDFTRAYISWTGMAPSDYRAQKAE